MHLSNDTNVLDMHIEVLGSSILFYLVVSKAGCLDIMDPNSMELHNLHCHVIYSKASIGELKVKFAAPTCLFFSPLLKIDFQPCHPTIHQKQETKSFMARAKSNEDDSRPWILFT